MSCNKQASQQAVCRYHGDDPVFAYSGSYLALLMLMMGMSVPLSSMLNRNMISAEILNIIIGSFGMVTVSPFTALAGGCLYRLRIRNKKGSPQGELSWSDCMKQRRIYEANLNRGDRMSGERCTG